MKRNLLHFKISFWVLPSVIFLHLLCDVASAQQADSSTKLTPSNETTSSNPPSISSLDLEKKKVSDLLQEAQDLGIGVSSYRAELLQIEEAKKGDDLSTERLTPRIEALINNLSSQIQKYKAAHPVATPTPVSSIMPAKENGWILTQATNVNVGHDKYKWIGRFIYCTENGWRNDISLEDLGTFSVSRAPDWVVYSCCIKNRTFTRGLETAGVTRRETDMIGDMNSCYTCEQASGPSPEIAGFKTKHYRQFYVPYKTSRVTVVAGPTLGYSIKDVCKRLSSEWYTADPQFLPVELRRFAKYVGTGEIRLRTVLHGVGGSTSGKSNSAKREEVIEKYVPGHKQLSFDTLSWKRAAVPSTHFQVPNGYRYVSNNEFLSQLTPGWIRELDRGNPKGKRVLTH